MQKGERKSIVKSSPFLNDIESIWIWMTKQLKATDTHGHSKQEHTQSKRAPTDGKWAITRRFACDLAVVGI